MKRCPKCKLWLTVREVSIHQSLGCKAREAARHG